MVGWYSKHHKDAAFFEGLARAGKSTRVWSERPQLNLTEGELWSLWLSVAATRQNYGVGVQPILASEFQSVCELRGYSKRRTEWAWPVIQRIDVNHRLPVAAPVPQIELNVEHIRGR